MMRPDASPDGGSGAGQQSTHAEDAAVTRQRTPQHVNTSFHSSSTPDNNNPTSYSSPAHAQAPVNPSLPPNLPPIYTDSLASHPLPNLTPKSMLKWQGSFDDQSVDTLQEALNESLQIDDDPFAEVNDARPILPKVAFFMGDLRDGLGMINMQSAFLLSKDFSQKQNGSLLFAFGISQVIFMAPIGFLMDKTTGQQKQRLLIMAGVACSFLTVLTAILAEGRNMRTMMVLKILQGASTAFQPPGLNSITLGIVGAPGFTPQVSRNIMMRHIGTALVVAVASLLAYCLYPNIGALFTVSPLFCFGLVYYLRRIKPEQIDADAARGLIERSRTMDEYEIADETNEALWRTLREKRMAEGGNVELSHQGGGADGADCNVDCVNLGFMANNRNTAGKADGGYVPPSTDPAVLYETPVSSDSRTSSGFGSTEGLRCRSPGNENQWGTTPQKSNVAARSRAETADVDNTSLKAVQQPKLDGAKIFRAASSSRVVLEASERIREAALEAIDPIVAVFDREMMVFSSVVFGFHLANSAVLPLVMQSVQLEDRQSGLLLSGLCILVAQSLMMIMSKIVGDYSPYWGRKKLFLICLFSLPVRCFILSTLTTEEERVASAVGRHICKILILSTQLFDAVGAGIFGTLYILITNDISRGTGRFSLLLGITTASMCLGCTFSSPIGAFLAEDFGYDIAFNVLGLIALVPAFICLFHMPETLPDYARPKKKKKRRRKLADVLRVLKKGNNPFNACAVPPASIQFPQSTRYSSQTPHKNLELV